jgi:arsenate reductase-like glutaredoxin family protein
VLYLDTPPTKAELRSLLKRLKLKPLEIICKGEDA